MRQLTIYKRLFYDSDCYDAGYEQDQCGVQVHCTVSGASYLKRWVGPDDGRLGKNRYSNYHNRPGGDVCANAYIGKLEDGTVACYQSLPWDYRCWLSANGDNGNANKMGYIGFEIAADGLKNKKYFDSAVMGVSVTLTAYLCLTIGVKPRDVVASFKQGDALAVMDHSELAALELASGHVDIGHWLDNFDLTMDDYRRAVEEAMQDGVTVTYIDCDSGETDTDIAEPGTDVTPVPLYTAKVTCPGKYLNLRSGKSKSAPSIRRMDRGVCVTVLDDSDPDWWRVEYADVTGYAMTHSGSDVYLVRQDTSTAPAPAPDPIPAPAPAPAPVTRMVTIVNEHGRKVNLRHGDSTSYGRVCLVDAGTKLEYVTTAPNGWHAVRHKSMIAWVSPDYSTLEVQ